MKKYLLMMIVVLLNLTTIGQTKRAASIFKASDLIIIKPKTTAPTPIAENGAIYIKDGDGVYWSDGVTWHKVGIQTLSLTDDELRISDDPNVIDLSIYKDNTDDQVLTYTPATGDLEIEDGNIVSLDGRYALISDLDGYVDLTTNQDVFGSKTFKDFTILEYGSSSNTTATRFGKSAAYNNPLGAAITAIGGNAAKDNQDGFWFTALGFDAGSNNIHQSKWLAVGAEAAELYVNGDPAIDFQNSVHIGTGTRVSGAGATNETAIGFLTYGKGSNTFSYGNDDILDHYFNSGNLNIINGSLKFNNGAELYRDGSDNLIFKDIHAGIKTLTELTDTGTDDQSISIVGHVITLEDGGTVIVPDDQNISFNIGTGDLSITGGNSTTLDGRYIRSSEKGVANGVANLDGTGKIYATQLPAIAFTDVYQVATIAIRDGLVANEGDVAIVSDQGDGQPNSYIWDSIEWVELKKPANAVSSVNGQSGIVNLTTTNIPEGTNKYYTTSRVNVDAPNVTITGEDYISINNQQLLLKDINLATNVTGILADGNLSSNVALRSAINTAGNLSNVAYLNQANQFTVRQLITDNGGAGNYALRVVQNGSSAEGIRLEMADNSVNNAFVIEQGGSNIVNVITSSGNTCTVNVLGSIVTTGFNNTTTGYQVAGATVIDASRNYTGGSGTFSGVISNTIPLSNVPGTYAADFQNLSSQNTSQHGLRVRVANGGGRLMLLSGDGGTTNNVEIDNNGNLVTTGIGTFSGAVNAGVAETSTWSQNTSVARFGHEDHNTATSYGVLQASNGAVFISSASGTSINLNVNNSVIQSATSTGIDVTGSGTFSNQLYVGTGTPFSGSDLQVRTGTNRNFSVQDGTTHTTGVKLNSFNDAANVNVPIEINGSLVSLKVNETEIGRFNSTGISVTGAGTFSNTVTASNFILSSDTTLKTFQDKPIVDLSSIEIRPFTFNADSTQRLRYGVSAQQLREVAPDMIYQGQDSTLKVAYFDFLLAKMATKDDQIKELQYKYEFQQLLTLIAFIGSLIALILIAVLYIHFNRRMSEIDSNVSKL